VPPKNVAEATSATLSAFYPALAEGQGFMNETKTQKRRGKTMSEKLDVYSRVTNKNG
jgi:hypothetical protein